MTIFPTDAGLGNRDNEERTKLDTYILPSLFEVVFIDEPFICSVYDRAGSKYDNDRYD
jgi:hypothetical protein